MLDLSSQRQGPLDAFAAAAGSGASVELSVMAPCARFVLRGASSAIAAAGQSFGVAPPQSVGSASVSGSRAALCLGPDEWLLLAPPSEAQSIATQLESAFAAVPHSLVDVSHRGAAILVGGAQAATLLSHGCPLDLSHSAFAVGACTRTLFEKTEIILWRKDAHLYHVETERSFAPYLWNILTEAHESIA